VEGYQTSVGVEWLLIALSVGVALAGIALARRWYFGPEAFVRPTRFAERFPTLYRTVANKYYVDEAYDATVVAGTVKLAQGCWEFDARVVDGAVNGTRHLTVGTSFFSGLFDLNVVDGLVNLLADAYGWASRVLRRVQGGGRAGVRARHDRGLRLDGRGGPVAGPVDGMALVPGSELHAVPERLTADSRQLTARSSRHRCLGPGGETVNCELSAVNCF
jgi:hypothetical protein